jgi:hypothetical protein
VLVRKCQHLPDGPAFAVDNYLRLAACPDTSEHNPFTESTLAAAALPDDAKGAGIHPILQDGLSCSWLAGSPRSNRLSKEIVKVRTKPGRPDVSSYFRIGGDNAGAGIRFKAWHICAYGYIHFLPQGCMVCAVHAPNGEHAKAGE